MKNYAEHLPKENGKSEALCGEKRNPIVVDLDCDNDPETWCRRCTGIACHDCYGTGIMSPDGELHTAGIYCSCKYAYFAMRRNGEDGLELGFIEDL